MNNPKVRALSREISLAAQTCCTGLTALRKASSEKTGVYYEAFFNLATGIERLCKIVIIVDYTLDHYGQFPTDNYLKKFGHDIQSLICKTKEIRTKYPNSETLSRFPNDHIVKRVIVFLSEFAVSTRYYNLDSLQTQDRKEQTLFAIRFMYGMTE